MKSALITGVTGQDGAYLSEFLLKKGYRVFGTYRRLSTPNFWRLQYLNVFDDINLIPCDLIDSSSLVEALEISKPDEIYNLAAQSFVGASFEQPTASGEITGLGVGRLLEAMRKMCPSAKLYQASTSELFGDNQYSEQDESIPFDPSSPYAAAKLYAYSMIKIYRIGYKIFACNGILFNHESPLRGLEFVTRKITNSAAKIKLGLEDKLTLGNLDSQRDWGYAPDYVESMWLMLQQDQPDDYVIATNEAHSVKEFLQKAFETLGLQWKEYVRTEEHLLRPVEVNYLKGNYEKARKKLGWKPKVSFHSLVEIMVKADFERWQRLLKGEHFPWDAPYYPNEKTILSRKLRQDK
ncbi:GDP-mannose 4,6-dehydratase [Thermodesulfobacteriota bacterium]